MFSMVASTTALASSIRLRTRLLAKIRSLRVTDVLSKVLWRDDTMLSFGGKFLSSDCKLLSATYEYDRIFNESKVQPGHLSCVEELECFD